MVRLLAGRCRLSLQVTSFRIAACHELSAVVSLRQRLESTKSAPQSARHAELLWNRTVNMAPSSLDLLLLSAGRLKDVRGEDVGESDGRTR
jgi:hypothetical protein